MLYFDETATSKPSDYSLEVFNYISKEFWGNPSSTNYDFGIAARRKLEEARKMIADCIGAKPEQIFFTSGSTEGANWILRGTPRTKAIFTTELEHPAVYETIKKVFINKDSSVPVLYLRINDDGTIDLDDFQHCLELFAPHLMKEGDNILVAITDSNNETGVCQPTKEIADMCHAYGKKVRLFVDMTQSFAHSDVYKADELGYDFAIASAQKFHAPRGVGFIYARHPDDLESFLYGGHQEFGKRAGTEPLPLIYSMAAQFEHECKVRKEKNALIKKLKDYTVGRLYARIGHQFKINGGDKENVLPSILSLQFNDCDANKLLSYLAMDEIYLSAGSACSTGENKPSRVLKGMGLTDREAQSTIRISLSDEITHGDIDKLVNEIAEKVPLCKWDT